MPKLYTFEQIINFTPEQLRSDPELLQTVANLYNGGAVKDSLLNNYGGYAFQMVKDQMQKIGNSGVAISVDAVNQAQRDIQSGRPVNQKSLDEIESAKKFYSNWGIDPVSVPIFKQIQTGQVPEVYGGKQVSSSQGGQQNNVTGVFKRGNDVYYLEDGVQKKFDNADPGSLFQNLKINTSFLPADGSVVDLFQAQNGREAKEGEFVPGKGTKNPDGTYSGVNQGSGSGSGTGTGSGTATTSKTGVPQLDALLERMMKMLEDNLASGNKINPNIELDPSVVSQFLAQAETEFEPYYSSQIKLMKEDLGKSLDYLGKQYKLGKEGEEAKFKETLAGAREGRANVGTVFSGGRGRQEQGFASAQNRNLELSSLAAEESARGAYNTAEKTIGSRNLTGLTTPQFSSYSASVEGDGRFTPGRSLSFTGTGDVVGSLERERTTAIYGRKNELEEAERSRRALNFYS